MRIRLSRSAPHLRLDRGQIDQRRVRRHVDPRLLEPVVLYADPRPARPEGSALYRIWSEIPEAHKWLHYFGHYDALLQNIRRAPIRLLEIGIYRGASLTMWRRYFNSATAIVGIDIDPACRQFDDPTNSIYCRIGSQADANFLHDVVSEFGPFDVIIDDGSHLTSHMIAAFNALYVDGLRSPGIYVAEDVHSNYWTTHRDSSYSFVDLCKDIVDLMHSHYCQTRGEIEFRVGADERVLRVNVPKICAITNSIQFFDSLVVIHKEERTGLPGSVHL